MGGVTVDIIVRRPRAYSADRDRRDTVFSRPLYAGLSWSQSFTPSLSEPFCPSSVLHLYAMLMLDAVPGHRGVVQRSMPTGRQHAKSYNPMAQSPCKPIYRESSEEDMLGALTAKEECFKKWRRHVRGAGEVGARTAARIVIHRHADLFRPEI